MDVRDSTMPGSMVFNGIAEEQEDGVHASLPDQPSNTQTGRFPFEDDSSEDERILQKPPSRIEASSGGTTSSEHQKARGDDSSSDGNAYERIKRQLMGGSGTRETAKSQHGHDSTPLLSTFTHQGVGQAASTLTQEASFPAAPDLDRNNDSTTPILTQRESSFHSSPLSRATSPGLFVTPTKARSRSRSQSLGEPFSSPNGARSGAKSRLHELVEVKRQERLAREAEVQGSPRDDDDGGAVKKTKPKTKKSKKNVITVESENDSDKENRKTFTEQARPTRKASKKAVEEMHRETQRMSRNMQLAHQAKTRTKFSTEDFFKKMNFRPPRTADLAPKEVVTTSSSPRPVFSDVGPPDKGFTPPSSPPSLRDGSEKESALGPNDVTDYQQAETHVDSDDDELPSLEEVIRRKHTPEAPPAKPQHAQKGNTEIDEPNSSRRSIRKFAKSAKKSARKDDSDDDLEIVVTDRKTSRLSALDNAFGRKSEDAHALLNLRTLAQLNDHGSKSKRAKNPMTTSELKDNLRKRAREQAHLERMEKIQALRDKGVVVQTDEEKERDQMQLDNMLEKARRDAEELARKEKEAAKDNGEGEDGGNHLPDSDDEDGDFEGNDVSENGEGSDADGEIEYFSGSEEENVHEESSDEAEEEAGQDDDATKASIFDNEAAEDEDDDADAKNADEHEESGLPELEGSPRKAGTHSRVNASRRKTVVTDDEEDSDEELQKNVPNIEPKTPGSTKSSAIDAFGFKQAKSLAVGLSQIWAGTMAESQTQDPEDHLGDTQDDPLDLLRRQFAPIEVAPGPDSTVEPDEVMVQSSQAEQDCPAPAKELATPLQSQPRYDTQSPFPWVTTQSTDDPDPTQDTGFQTRFSPALHRKSVGSNVTNPGPTTETVVLPSGEKVIRRRNRLRQGANRSRHVETARGEDEEVDDNVEQNTNEPNAFLVMRKATEKSDHAQKFDKKQSKAKGMIEEQAEESEDEYAGLGGASDDDSQGEPDDDTRKLIDDANKERLNEREVAAFHANKERADDERLLERLYKDINNGGFRRKRGADVDLLDSDDEEEAAARRRAVKQRDFAKMRKALLADEKIGKIAENPKRQAFLQAIEDRAEDDDVVFLDPQDEVILQTQVSQDENEQHQPLDATRANVKKRSHSELFEDASPEKDVRQAKQRRRTGKDTKPTSIAQIRSTLSELLGEGEHESVEDSQPDAEEDLEYDSEKDSVYGNSADKNGEQAVERSRPVASQRLESADPTRKAVIDRMALKRGNSSSTSTSNASDSSTRLAFQAPSRASSGGFKVPSLLRRATTNASTTSNENTDRSAGGMGMGGKDVVKMGGGKKSSVNYHVREQERKAKVEKLENERRKGQIEVGKMRTKGMGLGGLTRGTFG